MTPEDFKFKKECQETHRKVCNLLYKEKIKEANELIRDIEDKTKQLEEDERSIRLRSRLIRHLFVELSSKQRIKVAQLKKKQEA